MELIFLQLDEIMEIHQNMIQRYGGSPGVRDMGLLKSALAVPQAGFGGEYLHKDIFEMSAAYLYHIVQNHPFIDGNKRTGATCAFVFLKLNGFTLISEESAFEKLVRSAAQGKADKTDISKFLKQHSKPVR